MAQFRVEVKRSAARELEDLEPRLARRIIMVIETLASNPRPRQARKLTSSGNSYRLRVGAYRVLYQIEDREMQITVYAVGHRREIYR